MSRDRNTMAKRQREAEKRDKANRKREKKVQRRLDPPPPASLMVDASLDSPTDDA